MSQIWHNWCRLCGKSDSTETDTIFKVDSIKDQLDLVNKCFQTSLLPSDETFSSLCGECCNFLGKLKGFKNRCLKANQMFQEIMLRKSISMTDLQFIRIKFGVDKEENPTQNSNNIETQIQNEEIQIEEESLSVSSISSSDLQDENEAMVVEDPDDHIPIISLPGFLINELPTKKKLFIASYNQEKVYISVTYEGDLPEYDEFINCACDQLKLKNITIYDQDEREVTRKTFSSVFTTNCPPFVIIKTGISSGLRLTEAVYENSTKGSAKLIPKLKHYFSIQKKVLVDGGSGRLLKKKTLTDKERKQAIRIICDHLFLNFVAPDTAKKIDYAMATITLFPCLRVDDPKMPYKAVYNPQKQNGYLNHRIKNHNYRIQQELKS